MGIYKLYQKLALLFQEAVFGITKQVFCRYLKLSLRHTIKYHDIRERTMFG